MDDIQKLAEVFKALSDPTRLKLVKLLKGHRGVLCVNALADMLGATQSAVSQHLRVLRQAGLVRGERLGWFVHYSVDQEVLGEHNDRVRKTLGEDFVIAD